MTQYVGLDVSLKETKLHVLDEAGNRVWRGRCATDSAAIAATVRRYAPSAARIGLETGPLTTWLYIMRRCHADRGDNPAPGIQCYIEKIVDE
jgi:transposase